MKVKEVRGHLQDIAIKTPDANTDIITYYDMINVYLINIQFKRSLKNVTVMKRKL